MLFEVMITQDHEAMSEMDSSLEASPTVDPGL